jgi:integrase
MTSTSPPTQPAAEEERAWGHPTEAAWGTDDPITLHEARHTYASLMIAAGVSPNELCEWMGHASITTTLDRYGHLFPSSRAAGAAKLDRLLEEAGS